MRSGYETAGIMLSGFENATWCGSVNNWHVGEFNALASSIDLRLTGLWCGSEINWFVV